MNKLEFDICFGKVSEEKFSFLEEKMGVKLPKSYKENIKDCDGGYPLKSIFKYYSNYFEEISEGSIGAFIRIDNPEGANLLSDYYKKPELFPEGLIAFGENGGGDFICFDYRQGKDNLDPPIVYWFHEVAGTGKDVSFIAKNFEEFIGMLYTDEDED